MSILKSLTIGSIYVGFFLGLIAGTNHLFFNDEYISKGYHSVNRAEGIFTRNNFTKSYSDEGCESFSFRTSNTWMVFGSSHTYKDNKCSDGLVDSITISKGRKTVGYTREDDYESNMDLFDKADQELKNALEESEEYFQD